MAGACIPRRGGGPRPALPALAGVLSLLASGPAAAAGSAPYLWQNVAVGGGGYVTGIVAHPRDPGLIYLRTDIGGAYRWNAADGSWTPLTDHWHHDESDLHGVDALAVDPNDVEVVYIGVGRHRTPSGLFKSTDRGRTWTKIGDFVFDGNGTIRWADEAIAVDPGNAAVLYVGTRHEGLNRSTDGGETWSRIADVPAGTPGIGVLNVVVDGGEAVAGRSRRVYAGVHGDAVYTSDDGGDSWARMAGSPTEAMQLEVASDRTLYVTAASGVFKHAGSWQEISPDDKGYAAMAVARGDPRTLVVAADHLATPGLSPFWLPVHLSRDGGASWTQITGRSEVAYQAPWYEPYRFAAAVSDLLIDPSGAGRVWMADWYGVMRTEDIAAATVAWTQQVRGIEQMVVPDIIAPPLPGGAHLLSGAADNKGFRHTSLRRYPAGSFASDGETSGLDFCECDPAAIFKVAGRDGPAGAAYSMDNGATWTEVASPSEHGMGKVAVSAVDPNLVVVLPQNGAPRRSRDRGRTWQATKGVPSGAVETFFSGRLPIASDRVDGNLFYLLHKNGDFYRSTNGGADWIRTTSLPVDGDYMVKAVFGLAGEVWASLGNNGLYRSSDFGASFAQLPGVQQAVAFAFGKSAPGRTSPALFVYGKVGGTRGVFRSDDMGGSWVRINTDDLMMGYVMGMAADRLTFGRVYVATEGRGILYGEPAQEERAAQQPSASSALAHPG